MTAASQASAPEIIDLDTITIRDNYMFVTVFSDPELCRQLLERILGIEISRVVFATPEKTIFTDVDSKSVRLDVYVKYSDGTVYDIEMQSARRGDLLKRTRYYLSTIDYGCIKRGEKYKSLRSSFVIFVCAFDPFGYGLPRYTITPHCRETGQEHPDGATRLFVNATAWANCNNPQLKAFLHYLMGGIIEDDDFVAQVDAAVRHTRTLPEWRETRMSFATYIEDIEDEAEAKGIEEKRLMERRQNALLLARLREAGRESEFFDATIVEATRARLLAEFGIE